MTATPDHPFSTPTCIGVLDVTAGVAGALACMFLCDNGANVVRTVRDADHGVIAEPGCALWDRGEAAVSTGYTASAVRGLYGKGTTRTESSP